MAHQTLTSFWGPVRSGRAGQLSLAPDRRPIAAAILTSVGYYVGSLLGFALTFQPHPVSVLWPPNSILLAALLLTPIRIWWMLLLAAFPAHCLAQMQSNIPPLMILCYFVSNCCEALIGAGCVRYFLKGPVRFHNLRGIVVYCLFGAVIGPFLSSFLDASFVSLNQWGTGTYWELWRTRLFSNVLTALTVVPAIVTWFTAKDTRLNRATWSRWGEGALVLIGLLVVCLPFLYYKRLLGDPILFYSLLPILLWTTIRFGSRGTASAILTITLVAIWSAAHGHGPFTGESPEQNARSVQMFLIVIAIPFLFLGAMIGERQKADERFSKAFRCNPDAMWIARLHAATLVDVNEQWEKLFGYRRLDAIGGTSGELNLWTNPADRAEVVRRVEQGPVHDFEVSLCSQAGEIVPVLLSADRAEMAGEPCLIMIVRDLRDRKRADEAARDLVRVSRLAAVGELTASLAHELNQPLTAIASNAAAGRRFLEHGSRDGALMHELLEDVGSDARRAGDIIQGIHHLVRKNDGARRLVDLNDVIKEVLRLLHSDLVGRDVSVRTEFAFNLPPVAADPIHLQQVVLNLFLNSLEAMRETPAAKRWITVSTQILADSSVRVSVLDHGIGLPKDNPAKALVSFYTTKPNGMGMGLTIVRSIVEAHGGELLGENTPEGTCFSFRLPAAVAVGEEKVA